MDNNTEQKTPGQKAFPLIAAVLIAAGLYASSLYSYLLFHSLVELFSILTAFVIFVLAWHSRSIQDNQYLLFIGIAWLFVGAIELLHTLAYKGLGIFSGYTADLPTQLWIAFRYLAAVSFLVAPYFIARKADVRKIFTAYLVISAVLVLAIFSGRFPSCFIEGAGLTPFKIYSEYAIIFIFLAALGLLLRERNSFDRGVLRLMIGAILASVASELSFTQYVSVYGPANMIGHFFLLASMVFIYRAVVVTGIEEPSRLLFRNLKLSEEKITRLNAELRLNVARLEEANKELEAFSYSVSHDLRAPLRTIDGFGGILLEDYSGTLDDKAKGYLGSIRAASQRMARLIDALLNLSRLGRSELQKAGVDLSAMARSIAEGLKKTQPERDVEFVVADGLKAEGDERLLRVLMDNLLGNAWKFTGRHGRGRIEFGAVRTDGKPAYFVKDDGAGFDTAYADKLFVPFQRLHSAGEFPGTGIGLATVQRIVHRHGGRIWAEGEVGKGATFYFTL
jgi:signal transduction histidine kinase